MKWIAAFLCALALSAQASTAGTVVQVDGIASPQLNNTRSLRIYLPPSYQLEPARRYPVLYMHDGQNLFNAATSFIGVEWGVDETIDALVASGAMEEVIVVGVDNNSDRISEYTPCCDPKHGGGKIDRYARFIVDTVKPYVDQHYRTLPGKRDTAIMGSSLGGVAAIYIARKHPDVFGGAAGLSSSFWWNRRSMVKAVAARVPGKYYIDAGTEKDGLEDTVAMRDAMLAAGYVDGADLSYFEAKGAGHNETAWAARLERPLRYLFPARAVPTPTSR